MTNHSSSRTERSALRLLCGIDGGGTYSKVLVCNAKGEIAFAFQTGSVNHYGTGVVQAAETFKNIADTLRSRLSALPDVIFVGNSALDDRADNERVQALTRGVFEPAKVVFHSDVFVALLGHTLGQAGAMVVSGTGSMACGIDPEGVYHTAGGWGQILGDEGSAYHLALEGIRAALRGHDGTDESTRLTEATKAFFGLSRIGDLIEKIYNPPVEKSVLAQFAPVVEATAAAGDAVAERILQAEIKWIARLALAITRKCRRDSVGYAGSMIVQSERIRNGLADMLLREGVALQKPLLEPEYGALIGAFFEAGVAVDETIISNLKKHYA